VLLHCVEISHFITALALGLFLSSLVAILRITNINILFNIVLLGIEFGLDGLLLLSAGFGNLGGIDIGATTDGLVLLGTGLSNKG